MIIRTGFFAVVERKRLFTITVNFVLSVWETIAKSLFIIALDMKSFAKVDVARFLLYLSRFYRKDAIVFTKICK